MAGVKVKLRILYSPPLSENDQTFVNLGIDRPHKEGENISKPEICYVDWTINSHHVQNCVSIGVFQDNIHLQWQGNFMLVVQYTKELYETLLSYMTQ